jgi:thiol-disulfide isomerase/thioredoxin
MAKSKTPPVELYYFWKEHCAPCKAAHPIVERVAAEQKWPVTYLDVRSEEGEQYITPFNLMAVPSLVVLVGGRKVTTITGPELQNDQKILKAVTKYLT